MCMRMQNKCVGNKKEIQVLVSGFRSIMFGVASLWCSGSTDHSFEILYTMLLVEYNVLTLLCNFVCRACGDSQSTVTVLIQPSLY